MPIVQVLGMNLFGTPGNPFEGDADSNFNNFGASLVVLFQVNMHLFYMSFLGGFGASRSRVRVRVRGGGNAYTNVGVARLQTVWIK